MLLEKKIVVVLPAYNAEKTLKKTIDEIDKTIVDEIILVDGSLLLMLNEISSVPWIRFYCYRLC